MTVTNPASITPVYVGNGATTVFAYTFQIYQASDMVVTQTDTAGVATVLTLTTHYTLSGVGAAAGGNITLVAPLATDYTLVGECVLPLTQSADLRNQGAYFAETHESVFDKLTKLAQQINAKTVRSLRFPSSEAVTDTYAILPTLATRSSKFLACDSSGKVIAAAGTSADLTPVSVFINALLDDADAATARATLGAAASATAVDQTIVDAKGDIIIATAANTVARKAIGSDGDILVPNSGASDGANWVRQPVAVATANVRLVWNVLGDALTIAVKGLDGNNCSASNPGFFVFRVASLSGDSYVVRKVTSALLLNISLGSTLGAVNSQPFKVWACAIDNAGTVELAAFQSVDSSLNITPLYDDRIVTTVAEGGAGAADSAGVLYSTTLRSSVAMRVLGYGEWGSGLATAGTWASGPTKVQYFQPGVALPGQVLASKFVTDSAYASTTTLIPGDDTIPQNTEGGQFMTLTVARESASSLLKVSGMGNFSSSGANTISVALFQDATANALAAVSESVSVNFNTVMPWRHVLRALAAGNTTFNIRAGADTAGTVGFNGGSGARRLGGVLFSRLEVDEIAT